MLSKHPNVSLEVRVCVVDRAVGAVCGCGGVEPSSGSVGMWLTHNEIGLVTGGDEVGFANCLNFLHLIIARPARQLRKAVGCVSWPCPAQPAGSGPRPWAVLAEPGDLAVTFHYADSNWHEENLWTGSSLVRERKEWK